MHVVQNTWSDVTRPELNAFIAIFLAMALNILPAISDYWYADEMLGNAWIKQIMPRDRFQAINRYKTDVSGWYHQSDDEETGGITHCMVCTKGTRDAKTLGRRNAPYD